MRIRLKADSLAELRVVAVTSAIGLLSLAGKMAMSASAGRATVVCGLDDWLPVMMVAGAIIGVGFIIGSRPISALGFGVVMILIVLFYLPDATEAALHLGRGYPYADATLARIDEAFGFDWVAYAHWMDAHPGLWSVGRTAYLSMPALPLAVILALALEGSTERLATYFVAQILCLTAVAGIAILVPALGTYEYYRAGTLGFAHRDFVTADHMTRSLEWLRQVRLMGDGVEYHGLVSFPSYHAMSCVLDAWALWRVRWARWPMAALAALILIATPVQGSHYLIDIVAGFAIAILAIRPAAWLVAAPFLHRPALAPVPVLAPA